MLFEPLNSDGRKRSVAYHTARLSMLHARVVNRMEKVDHAVDQVEQAAADLVVATHQPAMDVMIAPRALFVRLEADQTLGM